jgi:FHA domain
MPGATDSYEQPTEIARLDPRPSLVVTAPEHLRGLHFEIAKDGATIGRDGDHVVTAVGVSRRHARVWRAEGLTWIEDCDSTNGTLVNGTRISRPVSLRTRDVVALGEVRARFQEADEVEDLLGTRVGVPTPAQAVEHTETTRYLCAASHLDEEFCRHVVAELLEDPFRAVAPSYGVDLPAVAKHALAASRRRLVRDVALLVILVLFLAVVARDLLSSTTRDALQPFDSESARALVGAAWPAVLLLILAWLIVGAEIWVTRCRVLAKLSLSYFDPTALQPRLGRRIARRLEFLAAAQAGNVMVFSKFRPFVGSGFPFDSWSFAIDITKGRRDPEAGKRRPPEPFDADELHAHLAGALGRLGLPGLHIGERLLVEGVDAYQDPRLLPDPLAPPVTHVDASILNESLRDQESRTRTYLCIEVTGWHGQLVVTIFVRAVRLTGSLFIEATSYALLPLKDKYYIVDTLAPQSNAEASFAALGSALVRILPRLVASPGRVSAAVHRSLAAARNRRDQRSIIREGRRFDYGAETSIREEATGDEYSRYFLLLDHQMYVKVTQERLLQGIGDFLRDHGIDLEEFNAQQTVINQNRTVNVGTISGSNVAVGQNAFVRSEAGAPSKA